MALPRLDSICAYRNARTRRADCNRLLGAAYEAKRSGNRVLRTKAPGAARGSFVPMAAYTITNIPTTYRGRTYRSRLEARWAAFFDRLGWAYEYEPFDLGSWSPDFAITAPFDALVEVKPATDLDVELAERICGATKDRCKGLHLITRVAPIAAPLVSIGWWASSYRPVAVYWQRDPKVPRLHAGVLCFTSDTETWITPLTGQHGSCDQPPPGYGYVDHTMRLWAEATNAVQWEPAHEQ